MKRLKILGAVLATVFVSASSFAQTNAASPFREGKITREEIVMVGRDVVLEANEVTRNVVVVSGTATIRGTVRRDVTVLDGSANVEGTIRGNLVVLSGAARLGPRAEVKRDVTIFGGALDQDPAAKIGGKKVWVAPEKISPLFNPLRDWLAKGLLFGRPLPPQLPWAWALAARDAATIARVRRKASTRTCDPGAVKTSLLPRRSATANSSALRSTISLGIRIAVLLAVSCHEVPLGPSARVTFPPRE